MIYSIQYLRGISALGVVFVHTQGAWGQQGVDIFFVISGYIMMNLMATKHRTAPMFFLARYLRIAPMYYFLTAVAIVAGCAYEPTLPHIVQSLLFIKYQWSAPVLTQGWTLDYEFIFYSVCAFSLIFFSDLRKNYIAISAVLLIASIAIDYVLFPNKAYGHFVEFWYGMTIYLLLDMIKPQHEVDFFRYKHAIQITIALLFVASYFSTYLHDANDKPFLRFLSYGIPAALIVLFSIAYEKLFGIGKNRLGLLLGNASYSIYLSHEITLHFFYKIFGIARHESLLSDLFSALVSTLVGVVIYLAIEKRIHAYLRHWTSASGRVDAQHHSPSSAR